MTFLLDDRFSPITTTVGFVETPAPSTIRAYVSWQEGLGKTAALRTVRGTLPTLFSGLEPLIQLAHLRTLFVQVGQWTAIFDCGVPQGDPPVEVLAQLLTVRGIQITAAPHTYRQRSNPSGSQGSTQWLLVAPSPGAYIAKPVRSIGASYDAGWVFWAEGEEQPGEDTARYNSRRVIDRFDVTDAARISTALGLDAFNANAYDTTGVVVQTNEPISPTATFMTLAEARHRFTLA